MTGALTRRLPCSDLTGFMIGQVGGGAASDGTGKELLTQAFG